MFLANENFPKPSTSILRESGYEVRSIQEESPGISDEEVIKIASVSGLIILTFDKDYGELIFRYSYANPPAVVYFREKGQAPEFAAIELLKLLSSEDIKLTDTFTVLEAKSIRQRVYKK
jgi:predicted nuclease of predicted toxin-antitoxin system